MGINENSRKLKIGDVYLMNFSGTGNEQHGWRPGVVFQNNTGNAYSPNIIALPLTSSIKKISQPTHVLIKAENSGLVLDSMVLCENPERMSKDRIGKYLTTLTEADIARVAEANILASSAIAYLDPNALVALWERANALQECSV